MHILRHLQNSTRSLHIDAAQENDIDNFTDPAQKASQVIQEPYFEHEPTVSEWLMTLLPTREGTHQYLRGLFPCIGWIPRYNWQWLLADSIAGLTVGLVVIPQAMAYALLATLSPDFGLYTSFAGAAVYWLFGTSKDIVIGVSQPVDFAVQLSDTYDRQLQLDHCWLAT